MISRIELWRHNLGFIKEGEEVQDGGGEGSLAFRSKKPCNHHMHISFIIHKMKQIIVEKMS